MKNDNGYAAVAKQTLVVLAMSFVAVVIAQPVFYLLSTTGIFEWSLSRFLFGSLYGMILGVGNFFAMAVSLVLLTATAQDAKEGKARAQSVYLLRQLVLIGFAVVGCLLPVFHIVAVLGALALTQLVIAVYAFVGNLISMKKEPPISAGTVQDTPVEENEEEDRTSSENSENKEDE